MYKKKEKKAVGGAGQKLLGIPFVVARLYRSERGRNSWKLPIATFASRQGRFNISFPAVK